MVIFGFCVGFCQLDEGRKRKVSNQGRTKHQVVSQTGPEHELYLGIAKQCGAQMVKVCVTC